MKLSNSLLDIEQEESRGADQEGYRTFPLSGESRYGLPSATFSGAWTLKWSRRLSAPVWRLSERSEE